MYRQTIDCKAAASEIKSPVSSECINQCSVFLGARIIHTASDIDSDASTKNYKTEWQMKLGCRAPFYLIKIELKYSANLARKCGAIPSADISANICFINH